MKKISLKADIYFSILFAIVFLAVSFAVFSFFVTSNEITALRYGFYANIALFFIIALFFKKIGEKLLNDGEQKFLLYSITATLIIVYASLVFAINAGYSRIFSPVDISQVIFLEIIEMISFFMLVLLLFYVLLSSAYLVKDLLKKDFKGRKVKKDKGF